MSLEYALERAYKAVALAYESTLADIPFRLAKHTTEGEINQQDLPGITLTATAHAEMVPNSGVYEVELKIEVSDAAVRESGPGKKLDEIFMTATRPLRYRNLPAMTSAADSGLQCFGMPQRGEGNEYNANEGIVTRSVTALFICRDTGEGPIIPAPDPLSVLSTLDAAGKVACAWILPSPNPAQWLTLSGANVTRWDASHGTHKINLAEVNNPPQWDASLFSNRGGVVFDGTAQILSGLTAPTGWPGVSDNCYMLAAVRQDATGADVSPALKHILSYGGSASTARTLARTTATGANRTRLIPGVNGPQGAADFSGAHTVGGIVRVGGAYDLYFDGALDGTDATATSGVGATSVKMSGALSGASRPWLGVIASVVVLNASATLQDFLDLEAQLRARVE